MTTANSGEETIYFILQLPSHSLSLSEVRAGNKEAGTEAGAIEELCSFAYSQAHIQLLFFYLPDLLAQGWHHPQ